LLEARRRGVAEAEVVWGDDVVAVGQCRDEVAEHMRAGREAVQEHDGRRVGRTGLSEEDLLAFDGHGPVTDGNHCLPPCCVQVVVSPGALTKPCTAIHPTPRSPSPLYGAAPSWPCMAPVSPTPPSSRRWPARSRPANLPGRNGFPPPSSRSAPATRGRG